MIVRKPLTAKGLRIMQETFSDHRRRIIMQKKDGEKNNGKK
jgi:hypothetical protein